MHQACHSFAATPNQPSRSHRLTSDASAAGAQQDDAALGEAVEQFSESRIIELGQSGILHHGAERVSVEPGDCVCYLPGDPEPHSFENTGRDELVIWAFGNRFRHEICVYPDQGVAFVEGLGAEVPLDSLADSEWTEERRKR
jgi:hypothetical protein